MSPRKYSHASLGTEFEDFVVATALARLSFDLLHLASDAHVLPIVGAWMSEQSTDGNPWAEHGDACYQSGSDHFGTAHDQHDALTFLEREAGFEPVTLSLGS